jgi:hypothetical protein
MALGSYEYHESSCWVNNCRRVRLYNLTAIYEPIVKKIWEPRRLTTLWAFMACYRDSYTFYVSYWVVKNYPSV